MKKTRYLASLLGLALCLSVIVPTAYCGSRTHQGNPPQIYTWYTDSDDAIVTSVEDGRIYTVNIRIDSKRNHHGLTLQLDKALLGQGLVAKTNHKPVSYGIALSDEAGLLMTEYEHFTLDKDKDYAITMKYIPDSARLECTYPEKIPDEELFVLGTLVGRDSNDGIMYKDGSCLVTFNVKVERVPEEPAKQPSSSSDQDSGFLNFTFSLWDLVLLFCIIGLFYITFNHAKALDEYRRAISELRRQPDPAAPKQSDDPEVQIDVNHMPKPMTVNFGEDETVPTGAASGSAEAPEAPAESVPDAEEPAANDAFAAEEGVPSSEEPAADEIPATGGSTQGDISAAERDQIEQMCDELEEHMQPAPDPLHPDGEA